MIISVADEIPAIWYGVSDITLKLQQITHNLDPENVWQFRRAFTKLTKTNNQTCKLTERLEQKAGSDSTFSYGCTKNYGRNEERK